MCSDDQLYKSDTLEALFPGAQEEAIMQYTNNACYAINKITRLKKKFVRLEKNCKEDIIARKGQEGWRTVEKGYQKVLEQHLEDLAGECGDDSGRVLYHLRRAFENGSYKLPANTRLFRGQDMWYEIKLPKVGDEDTLGAFTSTSHNLNVAEDFASEVGGDVSEQVIIELDCPEGTNAMMIGKRGDNTMESEILFAPDQKVKCTKVFTGEDGRTHVRYKLINDNYDEYDPEEWFNSMISYVTD